MASEMTVEYTLPSQLGETATQDADRSAAYDKWLVAEIQEAIDDPSPTIPHEEVMRDVRAAIQRARTKLA